MKIACLQFAPELGKTQENIRRADFLLEHLSPGQCDLLVLPELAFSGLASACLDAQTNMLRPNEHRLQFPFFGRDTTLP